MKIYMSTVKFVLFTDINYFLIQIGSFPLQYKRYS